MVNSRSEAPEHPVEDQYSIGGLPLGGLRRGEKGKAKGGAGVDADGTVEFIPS